LINNINYLSLTKSSTLKINQFILFST